MQQTLVFTPASVIRFLTTVVILLLTANLVSILCRTILDYDFQFIYTFDFNREYNIPSLYASLTLLACGLLLHRISHLRTETRNKMAWRFLAVVFLFLSADELIGIHENSSNETTALLGGFDAGGIWPLPGSFLIPHFS